jgi:hypothetical protein
MSNKDSKESKAEKESKLAHVPCKFYKAGACSAGQSCPFSHTAVDRGGPKETCQWYIKGNCKFAHKCALAHLLPGQPPTMDRKNKKAAQIAIQGGGGGGHGSGGGQQQGGAFDGKDKSKRRSQANGRERSGTGTGTDRPKPPGNLTATAPGQMASPAQAQSSPTVTFETPTRSEQPLSPLASTQPPQETPTSPLPATQPPTVFDAYIPSGPKRFPVGRNGSSDLGYGPIGSPPNASHVPGIRSPYTQHANHFSPGTSPRDYAAQPSTSPYKHNETQFFSTYVRPTNPPSTGNIASTAPAPGAGAEQSGIAIQQQRAWHPQVSLDRPQANDNAISENSDLEELLPSSLNDLLTPEERQRRASRSGGQRLGNLNIGGEGIGIAGGGGGGALGTGGVGSFGAGHRYSRSVPAARLLETTSLWKDTDPHQGHDSLSVASLSYRSSGLASDGTGFSPSGNGFLPATSNASGAFLHHGHAGGAGGLGHFTRGGGPNVTANTSQLTRQIMTFAYEESDVVNAMPTPTALTGRGFGSAFNNTGLNNTRYEYGMQRERAPPLGADMLSPSSKALQSHAPGQSLPQGLAAGLSRLHLVPAGGAGAGGGGGGVGLTNGVNSKLANEGMGAKPGVRSPLRSQFGNGAVGTPPDSNKFGLAALSSSPNVRSSWAPQSLLSGFSQHTSHQQQQQQQQQQQPTQQSLLSQSLLGQSLHTMGQGVGFGVGGGPVENKGLGANPVVSAPIPVRAGMGLGGIASMGMGGHTGVAGRGGDTEDELFALDED